MFCHGKPEKLDLELNVETHPSSFDIPCSIFGVQQGNIEQGTPNIE